MDQHHILRRPSRRIFSHIVYAALLILSNNINRATSTLFAQAQPQPCGGSAFARIGTNFYIQGGATSGDNLLEPFWALDLTKSWSTSEPAWTSLPLGPANAYHTAGYSSDNKSFITFGRDTAADPQVIPQSWVNIYNFATGAWSFSSNPPNVADNSRRDFSAVTNPTANKIYIMGGDAGPAGSITSNAFDTFDPSTRTLTEIMTPQPGPQNISTYSAVWVPRLSAMVVIGGSIRGGSPQGLYIYHPATGAWTNRATSGSFSYIRTSSCAASNADGSLIAVYGGFTSQPGVGDPYVYILDTTTWMWTTTPYSGRGRGNAACAIVDDTFLIWGGFYSAPNTVNGVPMGAEALLLFSVSKKTWLTTYTPSPDLAGSGSSSGNGGTGTGGSGSGSGNSGSSGMAAGAIGGIAAGAIVLLMVSAFLLLTRYRKNKRRRNERPYKSKSESGQGRPESGNKSEQSQQQGVAPPRPPPPLLAGHYRSLSPASEGLLDLRQSAEGGGANSSSGYSDSTTPTTMQFLATGSDGGGVGSEMLFHADGSLAGYRQSYQSDGAPTSVFYPPPPPVSMSQQANIPEEKPYENLYSNSRSGDRRSNDPQSIPESEAYYPIASMSSSPATTAATSGADQYHDAYGTKHTSVISSQSSLGFSEGSSSYPQPYIYDPRLSPPAPLVAKRPVSGPQGGPGFGSMMDQPPPGAPQAILQPQMSIHQHGHGQEEQQSYQPPPPHSAP